MCVCECAVSMCRCTQPELSQVKDREYQLRPAASLRIKTHSVSQITITQGQPRFPVWDESTNLFVSQVGGIYFTFAEATASETYLVFRFPSGLEGGEMFFVPHTTTRSF